MTELAAPRAVLFDWDNTLVDVWPAIHDSLNVTLVAMGHAPWSLDQTRERLRRSLRESFPDMFGANWPKARDLFYEHYAAIHIDRLVAFPGAGEAIARLKGRGLYLGVVSNKDGRYLREEAESLDWAGHFDRIVGATDAAADKPDSAPVRMALDGSGIAPGETVWFVGDGAIDVQCAVASGLTPIMVGGSQALDELARHGLESMAERITIISGVNALYGLVLGARNTISVEDCEKG